MPLEDGDLELIERNHPSALVQRLIWMIRRLRDEVSALQVKEEDQ